MPFEAASVAAGGAWRAETMKLVTKAALASLAFALPAQAADLFDAGSPESFPASQAPTAVEIGSNWYLRGDIGVSFDDGPTVTLSRLAVPPAGAPGQTIPAEIGPNAHTTDFDGTLGVGYRFNDYIRLDATWDYRTGSSANRSTTVVCPYTSYALSTQTTPAYLLGYFYNTADTYDGVLAVKQHTNTFLANAYVDVGTWSGFTPYLGGGLGVSVNSMSGGVNYYTTSNGYPYAADLSPTGLYPPIWIDAYGNPITPQPAIAFAKQNWNRTISSATSGLAWALMAGFSYQLTPSITIDIGYRYLNGGSTRTLLNAQTGTTLKQSNVSQQVRVGVRYLIQ